MIDYLENTAQESADVLLEEDLRLAAALVELRGQTGTRNIQSLGETASETDQLPPWGAGSPEPGQTPDPGDPSVMDPDNAEVLRLPLAQELERLDAALSQGEQPQGERTARAAGYAPRGELRKPAGAGTARAYELEAPADRPGGEQDPGDLFQTEDALQAGRLDRIFRRDSRRYDGGFYLY